MDMIFLMQLCVLYSIFLWLSTFKLRAFGIAFSSLPATVAMVIFTSPRVAPLLLGRQVVPVAISAIWARSL
jgi:hypothetical protein